MSNRLGELAGGVGPISRVRIARDGTPIRADCIDRSRSDIWRLRRTVGHSAECRGAVVNLLQGRHLAKLAHELRVLFHKDRQF